MRHTLTLPVTQLHAVDTDGDDAGTFTAIVSTFNRRVTGPFYDVMLKPGCFDRTLAERGLPACIWAHDWDTPPIGVTLDAKPTNEGLEAKARLFVADGEDSPRAREVYTAMRATNGDGRPALREFSIGFDVVEADWEVHDEDDVLAYKDVELFEFGPCLVGRNTSRLLELQSDTRDPERAAHEVLTRFPKPTPRRRHSTAARALLLERPRHL